MTSTIQRLARLAGLASLFAGLTSIATLGPLTAAAWAAAPNLQLNCSQADIYGDCSVTGTGFTPGGQVRVEGFAGVTVEVDYDITASANTMACVYGLKPHCTIIPGGRFTQWVPEAGNFACGTVVPGTVVYTDLTTGLPASVPTTWVGTCLE